MSLAKRSTGAALWNYGGNVTRTGLQFGIGVLLARLLGPQEFGLVATAVLMVSLGQLFVDFGFNAAIVQAKDLRQSDIDSLGTLQILFGAIMSGLAFLAAGSIAAFFHEPAATWIIRIMGLMFFMRSIGQNAVAQLNRDLRFRAVQISNVGGYVIGYILVAVPMAFMGYGAWALVIGQLVQSALQSIFAIYLQGHFHRLTLKGVRKEMLRFGRLVISANLGSWSLSNMDSLLVGHVLGSTSLSFYNRSMNLAMAPSQATLAGLQGVLFASASRAQDNPDGCRRAFYFCLEMIMLTIGPVLCATAACSSTVLLTIYGERWVSAASLLTPLCLAAVVNGVVGLFGPIIMGIGRIERETRAQWIAALIMVPCVYAATGHSAVAVAWSIIGLYFVRLALLFHALHSALPLSPARLIRAVLPGIVLCCFSAGLAGTVDYMVNEKMPVMLRFTLDVLAGAAGVLGGFAICHRTILRGELGNMLQGVNYLPTALRKWLNHLRAEDILV